MSRAGRSTAQRDRRNARRPGRRPPSQAPRRKSRVAETLIPETPPIEVDVVLPAWLVSVKVKNRCDLTIVQESHLVAKFGQPIRWCKADTYWLDVVVRASSVGRARRAAKAKVRGRFAELTRGPALVRVCVKTKMPVKKMW